MSKKNHKRYTRKQLKEELLKNGDMSRWNMVGLLIDELPKKQLKAIAHTTLYRDRRSYPDETIIKILTWGDYYG